MSYRLRYCHRAVRFKGKVAVSLYLIDDTDIIIRLRNGTWCFEADYAYRLTAGRWLIDNGLDYSYAHFPTRRAAMRAFNAASAMQPPRLGRR